MRDAAARRSRRRAALLRSAALGVALAWASLPMPVAAGDLADALRGAVLLAPRDGRQLGFAPDHARRAGPLSLDQAVARVRREHPKAEIVSAETREVDHGAVHVIKILRANGKIKVYRFDALTGAKLE